MDGLRSALDDLVVDVTPLGDLDRAIAQVGDERRRAGLVAAAAVIVLAIVVTATAVFSGPDASAPEPADPVGPQQLDGPPLTPYAHDGVLYVRGVEIETPWRRQPDHRGGGRHGPGGSLWRARRRPGLGHLSTATGSSRFRSRTCIRT